MIGSDKIGHFISQGRKFYKRYLVFGSEEMAAEHSAYTERAIFGQMSNGIYSNADLVANYEGHRFFRSLFEDGITPGKPAILRWEDNGWVVQREFDWADHVNEYWDEALNVNHFDAGLYRHMHDTFVGLCPQYWERPDLYTIVNEDELKVKYAHLQLRDTSELRLDSIRCARCRHSSTAIPVSSPRRKKNHCRMFQHLPDALNHRGAIVAVNKTMIERR